MIGALASAGAFQIGATGVKAQGGEEGIGLTDTYSTNTTGAPNRLFVSSEESQIELEWWDLTAGETLALVVEVSGENGQAVDMTAPPDDDLSLSKSGDGTNLRPGADSSGGVYFDIQTASGSQVLTLEDICGSKIEDFENGHRGLDLDAHHPSISMDDVSVDPDAVSEMDDLYSEYSVSASVTFARVETREQLQTIHDSFRLVYFLESSFGHFPGMVAGRSHPSVSDLNISPDRGELSDDLEDGLFWSDESQGNFLS